MRTATGWRCGRAPAEARAEQQRRRDLAQALWPVRRDQAQAVVTKIVQQGRKRAIERALAQQHGLHVVGDAQARRHVGLVGELHEDALARRMNRADPAALDERDQVGPALAAQARTNALAQLAGRTASEGDSEHLRRQVVALGDRTQVALDEHGRLAGASAGIDEHAARRLDGCELRWRQGRAGADVVHGRTRQMPL